MANSLTLASMMIFFMAYCNIVLHDDVILCKYIEWRQPTVKNVQQHDILFFFFLSQKKKKLPLFYSPICNVGGKTAVKRVKHKAVVKNAFVLFGWIAIALRHWWTDSRWFLSKKEISVFAVFITVARKAATLQSSIKISVHFCFSLCSK